MVLAGAVVGVVLTAIPAQAAVPTITQVFPTSASPSCQVTITGSNFITNGGPASAITFGGTAGSIVNLDADTQLQAVIGAATTANASNPVVITNTSGGSSAFSYSTGPSATCPGTPSISPTSGVVGTVVTITGTFTLTPTLVRFGTGPLVPPSSATANSAIVTVPAGSTTGPVIVYTTAGSARSATSFSVTTAVLPTITSFSPTTGQVGTSVVITGTNFTGITAVRFNGVSAAFTVNSVTQITATVPSGATTGPITVVNAAGTATGATFTVGVPSHSRTVTFNFANNSRVTGQVNVGDGFAPCSRNVPVVFQRRTGGGGWKWVDRTSTTNDGSYKTYIPPGSGTFRARVPALTLMDGSTCQADVSPTRQS
jgi:hypothetical protein